MKKIWVIIILCLLTAVAFPAQAKTDNQKNIDLIYYIPIDADIDPGMAAFVDRRITAAEEAGADLIIFRIDTFGGLIDSAIKIRDNIFKTYIPTLTFVSSRAWSAGALIALAGEEMAMIPESSIGAAETRPKEEKYISALRKEFSSTAEKRDKNSLIAEAMVDADIKIEGLVDSGKLLTLTAQEARKNSITDMVVNDFDSLLHEIKAEEADIIRVSRSPAETLADIITTPIFSVLFLTIGFIALWAEAMIPGWGIGGTVGILSLSLFFSGYIINGYGNWGLIALFIAGIFLIALEVLVVPGFGVTGIGGMIAVFSSLYFFLPNPQIALIVIASVMVLSIIGVIILFKVFGGSKYWENISLGESQTRETGYTAHLNKIELIGKEGVTLTPLRPAGTAQINNKRVDVVSEGGFIDKDAKIKVIDVSGSRIVVKKIT